MTGTSWRWRGVGTTAVAVGTLFATVVASGLAVLSAAGVYAVAMATDDTVELSTLVNLWSAGALAAVALGLLPAALVVRHFGGGHRVLGPVSGVVACALTWTALSVTTDHHPALVIVAGPVAGAVLAGGVIRPRPARRRDG